MTPRGLVITCDRPGSRVEPPRDQSSGIDVFVASLHKIEGLYCLFVDINGQATSTKGEQE